MVLGLGKQPPLTIGEGIAMGLLSPLIGFYFYVVFKGVAFVLRCIPAIAVAVRWCVYGHDRLLSRLCEQDIGWVKDY
jgi:hypothetical protein